MHTGYRPEIIQRAFIGFMAERVSTFWSLTTPKLRLINRCVLNHDLIALQFETNSAFNRQVFDSNTHYKLMGKDSHRKKGGWRGGQHIRVQVPIDERHHQRHYSLVGLPNTPLWWQDEALLIRSNHKKSHTITIAINPQGTVSRYLAEVALGTVIECGLPSGDFILPSFAQSIGSIADTDAVSELNSIGRIDKADKLENKPFSNAQLLCIAGGSGITPMLGLITEALAAGRAVTLLHYYHRYSSYQSDDTDLKKPESLVSSSPLAGFWQQLMTTYPDFSYHAIQTDDAQTYLAGERHISLKALLSLNLPLSEITILACGSRALIAGLYRAADDVSAHYAQEQQVNISLRNHIMIESFGDISVDTTADAEHPTNSHTITVRNRQQQFQSSGILLNAAEHAAIQLPFGCRQGICHLCRCQKISGVVKNTLTGQVSGNGYESIQTCITTAMTDVVLEV